MPNDKPKVFISHTEEDREIAERLYDDLKKAGASPWSEGRVLLVGFHKDSRMLTV